MGNRWKTCSRCLDNPNIADGSAQSTPGKQTGSKRTSEALVKTVLLTCDVRRSLMANVTVDEGMSQGAVACLSQPGV